ncbi:hypothetical protein M422DRAFT_267089 [Sphaerobolus stellatus SS14]|uniref:Uncharacterized protein n=1 Tax=Sphaerobolus stellatus (strain SS14) TaxID=990650 RepID=A0A0C9U9R4_SPHS4|nr:hypothetical protein M422DRAFT_267089 [Sphaerobolus stellatus SS14]
MSSAALPLDVEQIKAEGNALYGRRKHVEAIKKYDVAIGRVGDNAVLYANRAACYLALKKFQNARDDASKATEHDPNYAKAWGRLGASWEGLGDKEKAKDAYRSAIRCIDAVTPLTEANRNLKDQYTIGLTSLNREGRSFVVRGGATLEFPHQLAKQMPAQPSTSSAWLILAAGGDFENAREFINSVRMVRVPQGTQMTGKFDGLCSLSNALMMDERCFKLDDPSFIRKYNDYLVMEMHNAGAWQDTKDPQELINLANARLARDGWDKVRPALSVTLRGWLLRAFFGQLIGVELSEIVETFERTIRALELGRQTWASVPKTDRGIIFEDTFIRGVKAMHMNAYMKMLPLGKSSKFTAGGLVRVADAIIADIDNNPPSPELMQMEPAFVSAFFTYPKADAYAMKGFIYNSNLRPKNDRLSTKDARKAAELYLQSANLYPEDDEKHPSLFFLLLFIGYPLITHTSTVMLLTALEFLSMAQRPAGEMLEVMERIRISYPKMRRIWRNSQAAMMNAHARLEKIMDAETRLRDAVKAGSIKLEQSIRMEVM